MILLRNPVHCALMLVVTLFGVAFEFVDQAADFLAAVQMIVYAGAIVILFLFVIMFLGVDRRERPGRGHPIPAAPGHPARRGRPGRDPGAVAGQPVEHRAGDVQDPATGTTSHGYAGSLSGPGENIQKLGQAIYTRYLLPFEMTAALLVIAVVAAVVLSRRPAARRQRDVPRRKQERGRRPNVSVPGAWYLVLAAVLFSIGATGLLVRRNVLVMFMCVELMLNAVNLTFVTFARLLDDIGGQVVGVLRPGGGGRRGGGRAGDHRGHVPPAGRGDRRRHPHR